MQNPIEEKTSPPINDIAMAIITIVKLNLFLSSLLSSIRRDDFEFDALSFGSSHTKQ